jgi:hypothetical protein
MESKEMVEHFQWVWEMEAASFSCALLIGSGQRGGAYACACRIRAHATGNGTVRRVSQCWSPRFRKSCGTMAGSQWRSMVSNPIPGRAHALKIGATDVCQGALSSTNK